MPETLKAARWSLIHELWDQQIDKVRLERKLRELMKLAMEALLADLEYEQRPDGGWRGVAWTSLSVGYVDALLDGPAPGEGPDVA